jgi:uncharacterized protein with NAD-binding domain and iron-sulfur cluster
VSEEEAEMPKVAILGAGVAGMSAAQELRERGFDVEVYEARNFCGGKARSFPAPASGLPSEHGFRFFGGFYRHVIETMQDIQLPSGGRVIDNLTETTVSAIARYGKNRVEFVPRFPQTLKDVVTALRLLANPLDVPFDDFAFFARKMGQFITSCEERRRDEYSGECWYDFVEALNRSPQFRTAFCRAVRSFVAADPKRANVETIGNCAGSALVGMTEPESFDRVLNAPTSEAWIDPWYDYLVRRGVQFFLCTSVEVIECDGTNVTGVVVRDAGGTRPITADYYIAALPVEVIAALLTPSLLAADPRLANLEALTHELEWMSGVQYYLTERTDILHGHVLYADTEWALTSISQAQFWPGVDLSAYGDGKVQDILSVCVSDWNTKGLNGKTAKECTKDEIRDEVWEELKRSLNVCGAVVLEDSMLHSFAIDPAINFDGPGGVVSDNGERLLINSVVAQPLRPDAKTRIRNLLLAGDYVRTYTDLACMEGANEAARRAVNAIIDDLGGGMQYCNVVNVHEHPQFAAMQAADKACYDSRLGWMCGAGSPIDLELVSAIEDEAQYFA